MTAPDATTTGPLSVRRAGVLLHVTSLPRSADALGGDLGPAAYAFVDFLREAGCTVWQLLPLVPTHPVDRSPYNATSAMAGNPELVALEPLLAAGLLGAAELRAVREGSLSRRDARAAAAARFLEAGADPAYEHWCRDQAWLDGYVSFVALRESRDLEPWVEWPAPLRDRDPSALAEALAPLASRVAVLRVEQWWFASQWQRLRSYAAQREVLTFGDVPIFVSHDSADVWAHRELFRLDERGVPEVVTGVPPDYFAVDGQRWNNPHYDWDAMAADGFAWWRARMAGQRALVDLVRIDHFRGFAASWEIPADAETARDGRWVPTPGDAVLTALIETCGAGTLVAEDLGEITPDVEALRRQHGLPGMKVLQFAFGGGADNPYLPHHHEPEAVVYTGTHDNDTTAGWWAEQPPAVHRLVAEHLPAGAGTPESPPWHLVRGAMASVARLAVVPAQDLLGLGSESRMNVPGVAEGNWSWQAPAGAFDAELAGRVRRLVETYARLPL